MACAHGWMTKAGAIGLLHRCVEPRLRPRRARRGRRSRARGCAQNAERVALFTDAASARCEHVAIARALARRRGPRRRSSTTRSRRADRRLVPRRGRVRARGPLRRLRLGRRRLGHRHLQGGDALRDVPAPTSSTYVNTPIGAGEPVPGPLPPHIACPTTCGTGSECTGIAVFDVLALQAKTGIASRRLRPSLALVDPTLHRDAARERRRGERLRRALPRARVVHGAAVHGARRARRRRRRGR